ncbi:MAG: hypothetical protein ACFFDN_11535 [Candidatus Hodarchaeota archaeon]
MVSEEESFYKDNVELIFLIIGLILTPLGLITYTYIFASIIFLMTIYIATKIDGDERLYTQEKKVIKGKYIFFYLMGVLILFFISLSLAVVSPFLSVSFFISLFLAYLTYFCLFVLVLYEVILNIHNRKHKFNSEYHQKTRTCYICNFEILNNDAKYCSSCGCIIPIFFNPKFLKIYKKDEIPQNDLKYCPYCNFEIKNYNKASCENCGTKIFRTCRDCNFLIIDNNALYCEICGKGID